MSRVVEVEALGPDSHSDLKTEIIREAVDPDNSDEIIMNTDEMIEAKLNALKEQVPTGLPKQFNKE